MLVVAMLDEVAWLFKFNPHGTDIESNTTFLATWQSPDKAITLLVPDVWAQLGKEVQLRPYDAFIPNVKVLGANVQVCLLNTNGFSAVTGCGGCSTDWR